MEEKFKELFREYRDGKITRREFMPRAVAITGSLVAANSLHEHLSQPNAHAAQVDAGDPTVLSHDVNFPGKAGTVFGYLARPSAPGKYPAVIAIHANQGLNDYARDVARRFVKEKDTRRSPAIFFRATATPKKLIEKAKG